MSLKKFYATSDTSITNAYRDNLINRATASNMGASDSLEVFSIYGQATTSSLEKCRILIKFDTDSIQTSRSYGKIPASGSVNFYLKLFNVEHPYTLPKDFYINIAPLSQSWEEGYGLDMEQYTDIGFNGINGYGTNWIYARSGSTWNTEGGDILNSYNYSYYFKNGTEDIDLNITPLVEEWISGTIENNGLLLSLSGSYENGSQATSFYTKKFSARGTEYFYKQPCLEARWDSSLKNDRIKFYNTSSVLSDSDNTMYLYFYNKVAGIYKNITSNPDLIVKFYSDSNYTNEISPLYTSSVENIAAGSYKIGVRLYTTASILYDKWFNSSSLTPYYSSSFNIYNRNLYNNVYEQNYVLNITNLKSKYNNSETAKFKVYTRLFDWSPTVYRISNNSIQTNIIENLYYKIFRIEDNYTVIDYSTGSVEYTKLGYDTEGNYFDLDLSYFEKDYSYGIKFAMYDGSELKEFKEIFKMRIE